MATAAQVLDEQEIFLEQIGELALPPGITFSRMEDTSDWTGEPSVTFYFAVSTSIPLSRQRRKRLLQIKDEVRDRILPITNKYPYIRYLEVR